MTRILCDIQFQSRTDGLPYSTAPCPMLRVPTVTFSPYYVWYFIMSDRHLTENNVKAYHRKGRVDIHHIRNAPHNQHFKCIIYYISYFDTVYHTCAIINSTTIYVLFKFCPSAYHIHKILIYDMYIIYTIFLARYTTVNQNKNLSNVQIVLKFLI